MKDTSAYEQCTAYFEGHRCERPAGHNGEHRDSDVTWTHAGAERVRKEKQNKQAAKAAGTAASNLSEPDNGPSSGSATGG
jgi:hypothetical protein